jgi:phosphatidylglycerophosphate synthase
MFKNIRFSEVRERIKRSNAIVNNRIHWFSSRFSTYFSYVFINLGLSADAVTFLFLLTGVFGAINIEYPILSYVLWRLHIIFDMSDGDVARFNKSFSSRGQYWDRLNHSIINPLYCLLIGNNLFLVFNDILFLKLGIILMFTQFILLNVKYYYTDHTVSLRNSLDGDKYILLGKNILLDLFSMEGLILSLVLLAEFIPKTGLILLLCFYIALFMLIAAVKFYENSYR